MIEHNNKKYIFTIILLIVILLTGCNKVRLEVINDNDQPDTVLDNTIEGIDTDLVTNTDINKDNIKEEEDPFDEGNELIIPDIKPADNIELLIYTVNDDAEIEAVIALIPNGTEITPQLIIDKTVNSMADNSIMVGIDDVTTKGDIIIVSFYSDQPPIINVGAGMETSILNAIAQSLTANLDDYNKIVYQVDGNGYRSGHIELEIDEIYFEDNNSGN